LFTMFFDGVHNLIRWKLHHMMAIGCTRSQPTLHTPKSF
jgi:hypothetical protein